MLRFSSLPIASAATMVPSACYRTLNEHQQVTIKRGLGVLPFADHDRRRRRRRELVLTSTMRGYPSLAARCNGRWPLGPGAPISAWCSSNSEAAFSYPLEHAMCSGRVCPSDRVASRSHLYAHAWRRVTRFAPQIQKKHHLFERLLRVVMTHQLCVSGKSHYTDPPDFALYSLRTHGVRLAPETPRTHPCLSNSRIASSLFLWTAKCRHLMPFLSAASTSTRPSPSRNFTTSPQLPRHATCSGSCSSFARARVFAPPFSTRSLPSPTVAPNVHQEFVSDKRVGGVST